MFGLPTTAVQFGFNMLTGPIHNRFWFLTKLGDHLIQFQQDRLLHNWRKIGGGTSYPRFESILPNFKNELEALDNYFQKLGNERLVVTQAEISYINHIPLDGFSNSFSPQQWLSFIDANEPPVDEFALVTKHILSDKEAKPYGRLYRESVTGSDEKGRKILSLTYTVRGRPAADSIENAIEFIIEGRHMIAEHFVRSTTPYAHEQWRRVR
jgi:uncharacterized protein (TIGR04255 family)